MENNYKEYLDSYAWKAIKKMKMEENSICECCWEPATTVHHLSYERRWSEKEDDIVSVCERCHNECHFINWYQIKNDELMLRKRFEEIKNKYLIDDKLIWYDDFFNTIAEWDTDNIKEYIKNGGDINIKQNDWTTPLIYASVEWNSEIIELLLKNWADINIQDKNWLTALMYCISWLIYSYKKEDYIKSLELLLKNWADINIQDNYWWTALIRICLEWEQQKELVRILLKNWADINIRDKDWRTAIIYAQIQWHKEIIELLIQNNI